MLWESFDKLFVYNGFPASSFSLLYEWVVSELFILYGVFPKEECAVRVTDVNKLYARPSCAPPFFQCLVCCKRVTFLLRAVGGCVLYDDGENK